MPDKPVQKPSSPAPASNRGAAGEQAVQKPADKPADGQGAAPEPAATEPAAAAAASPSLAEQRRALDDQIRALQKQERELADQRRRIDREMAAQSRNAIADRLMGPVTPGTAGEQTVVDPGAVCPVEPGAQTEAAPAPRKKRLPFFSRKADPTKAQRQAAGPGIERRNGTHREPRFVTLLHHTMSEATAVYAILCLIAGVFSIPLFISIAVRAGLDIAAGGLTGNLLVTTVIFAVETVLMMGLAVGFFVLASRMVRGDAKWRLRICEGMLVALVGVFLCHLMVFGMTLQLAVYGLYAVLLIALHSYWDPELALERANRRTSTESLHDMIFSSKDERTVVPGKRSGKGYITLNFFNIFWIFTICCVIGLFVEEIVHVIFFHAWQDRAGMLWGPLSPIYGFGGTLMTIALNRFHNKPWWLIFIVSAVIGGAFEFFTSWFMQTAFGITAWNYSGTFLNIDGRTNFFFMCCWGTLGLVWVKLLLPVMLYFVKKIPWGWRYTLTTICAIFMIFDGVATLTTIDCWYLREAGVPATNAIEKFCAVHYDNEYMQNRFQTMTMDVNSTARTK